MLISPTNKTQLSLSDMKRKNGGWGTGLVHWANGGTAFISVVFSWQIDEARRLAGYYGARGFKVRVGGPAVHLAQSAFEGIAQVGGRVRDGIARHNKQATFTSRGCSRRCGFCIVPTLEGNIVELNDWPVRPIICDNNILACSRNHFDRVIDKLKPVRNVDFNQGLDARLLTSYHASRIAELDFRTVRLAWDNINDEPSFLRAFQLLRNAAIPKRKISVYVLIGFNDTPDDALYRLNAVKNLGVYTFPMRYQPTNTPIKNSFVASGWTDWKWPL